MRQTATESEAKTRQVQQAASSLHPAIKNLLKQLRPPASAKQAASPEPPVTGKMATVNPPAHLNIGQCSQTIHVSNVGTMLSMDLPVLCPP